MFTPVKCDSPGGRSVQVTPGQESPECWEIFLAISRSLKEEGGCSLQAQPAGLLMSHYAILQSVSQSVSTSRPGNTTNMVNMVSLPSTAPALPTPAPALPPPAAAPTPPSAPAAPAPAPSSLPLPDIVLCSALSAGIAQARRQRRQRHPATVQTPGFLRTTEDPDIVMEPLVQDMETVRAKKQKKQKNRLVSLVRLLVNFPLKLKSCSC